MDRGMDGRMDGQMDRQTGGSLGVSHKLTLGTEYAVPPRSLVFLKDLGRLLHTKKCDPKSGVLRCASLTICYETHLRSLFIRGPRAPLQTYVIRNTSFPQALLCLRASAFLMVGFPESGC